MGEGGKGMVLYGVLGAVAVMLIALIAVALKAKSCRASGARPAVVNPIYATLDSQA